MANKTLADEIITLIKSQANDNPAPTMAKITKVYPTGYVDLQLNEGDYNFVRCYGDKIVGDEVVVLFVDAETPVAFNSSSINIEVDNELSETSINPVQNKVITIALNDKVDKEEGKGLFTGSYNDLTDVPQTFPPTSHNQNTSTITNNTAFDNILTGESTTLTLTDQNKINTAINNVVGDLKSIKFIVITDNKGTASVDTMGKLYIVNENSKVNVYFTRYDGSSYSWEKMDTDILDELVVSWNDVQNKPNFSTVATSGSYSDLSNKPSIPSDVSELTDNNNTRFTPKAHTHGNLQNNGQIIVSGTVRSSQNVITTANGYITTEAKPVIPTKTSDLTNDSNFISTSNTTGLIKNDGTIDTTSYSTFTGSYTDLTNKPSIPTKTSDLTNDGDGTNIFVKDNDSRLSDSRTPKAHTHIKSEITDFPTIPSKISDLTNDSDFIETSQTAGLIKNDGTIDTTSYSTFDGNYNSLTNKPTIPSDVSELTDNQNTEFTPKSHNHTWTEIASSTTDPTKYHLYVNSAIRLAELIIAHKNPNSYSGTTSIGLNVGASYVPLGIAVRMTNKENIRLGVATNGDVYIYGSVNANTNVQASIMWHY